MKIFVTSNDINVTVDQQVKRLAHIKLQDTKNIPVILIDEFYNLDISHVEETNLPTIFHLDDFLHKKGNITNGVKFVDADQIATRLCELDSKWMVFEFGQNDHESCLDFLKKLARYNFTTPTLRNKSVVFSVSRIYHAYYARIINESFVNHPHSSSTIAKSPQVGLLMLSTQVESVFHSLPLLAAPLKWLNRPLMRIYQMLANQFWKSQ